MDTQTLVHSTLSDLQGAGQLFLRRQLTLGVLKVNFERAAIRLRLLDPDQAEVIASFVELMGQIGLHRPDPEVYTEVGRVLDRFEHHCRWQLREAM